MKRIEADAVEEEADLGHLPGDRRVEANVANSDSPYACKPSNQKEENIMAKQSRLLDTKTVRLNKSDLKVRYAELGDSTNPPVLLLHGVPENLQA